MKRNLHILTLIAFLGGILAPACGFAWGGKYSVIEICTANGIESRVVENDDQPEKPHFEEQCQFCFTSANLTSFVPPMMSLESLAFKKETLKFIQYEVIIFSRLKNNLSARGPPLFS